MKSITNDMMERAWEIWLSRVDTKESLRAAIEAVAPMLIAKWLHEEADKVTTKNISWYLTARAQELDPK